MGNHEGDCAGEASGGLNEDSCYDKCYVAD